MLGLGSAHAQWEINTWAIASYVFITPYITSYFRIIHQLLLLLLLLLLLGDQVLYQLIEAAYEYLDSVNEGECLICTDTLAVPSSLSILSPSSLPPSSLYSLRIPSCYHCYHVSCLCKWAAITMTTGIITIIIIIVVVIFSSSSSSSSSS